MKQHITTDDLAQLSQEQREKLIEWFKSKDYFPQFTQPTMMLESFDTLFARVLGIGQMIEYLTSKTNDFGVEFSHLDAMWVVWWGDREPYTFDDNISELADVLWEAVKEVLREQPDPEQIERRELSVL